MNKLISTLNEIYAKNSFSTRKNLTLERMNFTKFNINNIIYGKRVFKINNKEIFVKSNEILISFVPYFIHMNLFNKNYKKSIKRVLKNNDSLLKELNYQQFISYTNHSVDIFINGVKKDISKLKFIFNNDYDLYIKIPNNELITSLHIFSKEVKSHSVYIKSNIITIPDPYNNKKDYMLFINGLNVTTYSINDNQLINSSSNGSIIEIIQFPNNFNREIIDSEKSYHHINNDYELSTSSLLIFSPTGNLLDMEIEEKTNNILKFNSHIDINKYIFYPSITKIHHSEENYITKYIKLFGVDDLINKLNSSTLSLPLLEYLNSINELNNTDAFNISEEKFRELYEYEPYEPIDTNEYNNFLITTFNNILTNYNLGLYDLYIQKFIIKKDIITFNTNIFLNKKIIYNSNFSNGNIDDWLKYQNGTVTTDWLNGTRYLKRISNGHPNGAYKILSESFINYIITFNFVKSTTTDPVLLSVGLVNSSYTGKIIYLNMETSNEYVTIRSIVNGNIIYEDDEVIPINFSFKTNTVYTIKLIKNIQDYELYIYNLETNEENSFSIKEDLYQKRRIRNGSDTPIDRILIQGSIDLMYNNIQIRNISITDQSLPPRSSLLIGNVPFTVSLPNINHIVDKPSYLFLIQTNKDIQDKFITTTINGIRVSNSLQTLLMNYDEKYGLQNFFTILIEKNIFSLQGGEKIEVEFFDNNELALVTEYVYFSQEPIENSILTISKSDGPHSYLMDANGDYILDENGDYILVAIYDTNKYKYRIYKNGRYISHQYFDITEDEDNIYIHLDFHIEYQDIITIEYCDTERNEIYHEKQIDPSGICIITDHKYPLTCDYYDFYINGRKLDPNQIEIISEHIIRIKDCPSLYNLEIVEKVHIDNDFIDSYTGEDTELDQLISDIPKSELAEQLGYEDLIESEFDNIMASFNIIKTLYQKLYDEYLKMNVIDCSSQIDGDILMKYQMLQDRFGNIPVDAMGYQIKYMPLDPSLE